MNLTGDLPKAGEERVWVPVPHPCQSPDRKASGGEGELGVAVSKGRHPWRLCWSTSVALSNIFLGLAYLGSFRPLTSTKQPKA